MMWFKRLMVALASVSLVASASVWAAPAGALSNSVVRTVPLMTASLKTTPPGASFVQTRSDAASDGSGGIYHFSRATYAMGRLPATASASLAPVPKSGFEVDVATSSSSNWASTQKEANTENGANQAGTVAGVPAYYNRVTAPPSSSKVGPSALAYLTWTPVPSTQITIESGGRPPLSLAQMKSIAAGISLKSTGKTMAATTQPNSTDAGTPVAVACDGSCPASTDINGAGALANDWNGNETVCNGCSVQKGNIVAVWQAVMWASGTVADGLANPGFNNCNVDGVFGQFTADSTESWQSTFVGSGSDGVVGPVTWQAAGFYLHADGTLVSWHLLAGEEGQHTLFFKRESSSPNHYSWTWHNNTNYYYTGYRGTRLLLYTSNCSV
jgi:hypothetical protein